MENTWYSPSSPHLMGRITSKKEIPKKEYS